MKTEMENKRINIWTFTLFLWHYYIYFYIPKFKGNYWLQPFNIHLLNIYSEAHFFLSDFIWHIYNGYVQTYGVPLYLHEFVIRTNYNHIIVNCLFKLKKERKNKQNTKKTTKNPNPDTSIWKNIKPTCSYVLYFTRNSP